MPIDSEQFRDALRHVPAGVCIVTSRHGDRTHGMTVSAFASVSAAPPMIAVVIDRQHSINPLLEGEPACFAVNILAHDQQELADRFAFVKDEDRFLAGRWRDGPTGPPVLDDALAWLDCRLHQAVEAGSHTIYIGEVEHSLVVRPEEQPLLYWNRDYRHIANGGQAAR